MRLRVEDPFIQTENIVIIEEEPEVLEGFSHDEALLDVILGSIYVVHISDARIPSCGDTTIPFQSLYRSIINLQSYQ